MIFGKNKDRGLRLNGLSVEIVNLEDGKVKEDDLLFHDEKATSTLVYMLSRLRRPDFPEPIGVFRDVITETFEEAVLGQINESIEQRGRGNLQKLFNSGETWKVGA